MLEGLVRSAGGYDALRAADARWLALSEDKELPRGCLTAGAFVDEQLRPHLYHAQCSDVSAAPCTECTRLCATRVAPTHTVVPLVTQLCGPAPHEKSGDRLLASVGVLGAIHPRVKRTSPPIGAEHSTTSEKASGADCTPALEVATVRSE